MSSKSSRCTVIRCDVRPARCSGTSRRARGPSAVAAGAVVDLSVYESMVVAMGSLSAMSASVLGEDSLLTQRSLELPSIVPTVDGLVGFCTITAQQFRDFLVLIERPDLVDDGDLASMA